MKQLKWKYQPLKTNLSINEFQSSNWCVNQPYRFEILLKVTKHLLHPASQLPSQQQICQLIFSSRANSYDPSYTASHHTHNHISKHRNYSQVQEQVCADTSFTKSLKSCIYKYTKKNSHTTRCETTNPCTVNLSAIVKSNNQISKETMYRAILWCYRLWKHADGEREQWLQQTRRDRTKITEFEGWVKRSNKTKTKQNESWLFWGIKTTTTTTTTLKWVKKEARNWTQQILSFPRASKLVLHSLKH